MIKAVEALLTLRENVIKEEDFFRAADGKAAENMIITGHFSDIDPVVAASPGFRGRVVNGVFSYRKIYSRNAPTKPTIEAQQYPENRDQRYKEAKTFQQLIDLGIKEDVVRATFGEIDYTKNLPKDWEYIVPGAVIWHNDQPPTWTKNPGGFSSVVNSKLPKLLHIPSYVDLTEFEKAEAGKTKLGECLSILFDDLLHDNQLAIEIKERLRLLQAQMSPEDEGSLVGSMCKEISMVVNDVFPDCGMRVLPSLLELTEVLKPKYQVDIFSNIPTDTERQGTGLIRTVMFAMLRFHASLSGRDKSKSLVVAFEEPEIYLHPSAANLLRDTIYELGQSDQIICTSHSPWMIDLSRDPQSITRLSVGADGSAVACNFGVSRSLSE